jgi:exo-beta-1,3-glucanase (GH17 family)
MFNKKHIMKAIRHLFLLLAAGSLLSGTLLNSCENQPSKTAAEILGNPDYLAISYGGYRQNTREVVPTVEQLKEDMLILEALGIKILRTYNTQQFAQAERILQAIHELKEADPTFEMYVMLGAWIDCLGAWTDAPDHSREDPVNNQAEIDAAVELTTSYPDIVKVIAVGNEAMVHWAGSYYVGPEVILKWVNYLQNKKQEGQLPEDLWITSSDNFASWGGGDASYHKEELRELLEAVDYISMHTYPFHDSHYNPDFWLGPAEEEGLSDEEKIDAAMLRARDYALSQYQAVEDYMTSVGIDKPIHVGETGWASTCGFSYGPSGSRAADEYKQKLYHDLMREWSASQGVACFYFEAFDESWKDRNHLLGSENHFGLIDLQGQAKYVLWEEVDQGLFEGLTRGGKPITKSHDGNFSLLMEEVLVPPSALDQGARFDDVTSMLYLRADEQTDGQDIYLTNISYTTK